MREPSVRITPGGRVVIDTGAWIARRIRAPRPDLVADLRAWVESFDPPDDGDTVMDWTSVTQAWCAARGHDVREPGLIVHEQTRLDARLWVLLLDAADGSQVAVVGINDNQPACTPTARRSRGYGATPTASSSPARAGTPGPGARAANSSPRPGGPPLSPWCSGPTWTPRSPPTQPAPRTTTSASTIPCECNGSPWIVCPLCGQRCDSACPTHKPSDQHPAPAGRPRTPPALGLTGVLRGAGFLAHPRRARPALAGADQLSPT